MERPNKSEPFTKRLKLKEREGKEASANSKTKNEEVPW